MVMWGVGTALLASVHHHNYNATAFFVVLINIYLYYIYICLDNKETFGYFIFKH